MSAALDFLRIAYADKPADALLSVVAKPNFGKPYVSASLEKTAAAIEGSVDLWLQATAMARRPPNGERAPKELACWAPGLWIDLDVNGSPRNNGKPVAGAAPNVEEVIVALHELIEPSLVWSSGWGCSRSYSSRAESGSATSASASGLRTSQHRLPGGALRADGLEAQLGPARGPTAPPAGQRQRQAPAGAEAGAAARVASGELRPR